MLDKNQIKKRISEVCCVMNNIDEYSKIIDSGKIDILNWCIDKTEEELLNKIQRLKEEMLCLTSNALFYQEKQAKIDEINYCLER